MEFPSPRVHISRFHRNFHRVIRGSKFSKQMSFRKFGFLHQNRLGFLTEQKTPTPKNILFPLPPQNFLTPLPRKKSFAANPNFFVPSRIVCCLSNFLATQKKKKIAKFKKISPSPNFFATSKIFLLHRQIFTTMAEVNLRNPLCAVDEAHK